MAKKHETDGKGKQRRTRQPDKTSELFPGFMAGIERAKRVRAVLRKLAGWPAADLSALVEALRERVDPPAYLINPQPGSVQPIMPPPLYGHLTVTCATDQQTTDAGQPAE